MLPTLLVTSSPPETNTRAVQLYVTGMERGNMAAACLVMLKAVLLLKKR